MIILKEKVKFDLTNKKHLEDFKYFLQNNNWKDGCNFSLEWPYTSIPEMIKDKIVKKALNVEMV